MIVPAGTRAAAVRPVLLRAETQDSQTHGRLLYSLSFLQADIHVALLHVTVHPDLFVGWLGWYQSISTNPDHFKTKHPELTTMIMLPP